MGHKLQYARMIGQLNFLEESTMPDIAYAQTVLRIGE